MTINKQWFEFDDVLRREFKDGVWIPLWWHQSVESDVKKPDIGYWEDYIFVNAIMTTPEEKEFLLSEECHNYNPCHQRESMKWNGTYYRADQYYDMNTPVGEFIVLYQEFGRKAKPQIRLNQDIVFALELIEDGNNWIRPAEGYEPVIRQYRDKEGEVYKVEILAKYLKDYLCARGMGLALGTYRERVSFMRTKPGFGWNPSDEECKELGPHCRWNGYSQAADDRGDVSLGKMTVSTCGYKEIKTDDVPRFDPQNDDDQMYSETFQTEGNPITRYRVVGELRRIEWIEPGKKSTRVGEDEEESLSYYSEADGSLKHGDELEYPPQWLWFENDVINRILRYRGARYTWHSYATGSVEFNTDWSVHFGVNKIGLINVLAKDIVELPLWQQEVWKSYNVTPEGGVSEELQDNQMRCRDLLTTAPEKAFFELHQKVGDGFRWYTGKDLYKALPSYDDMQKVIHRFVVQKDVDLFRLAKEIIRCTTESFNIDVLRSQLGDDPNVRKLGSLKLMERFIAKFVSLEEARVIMSPLFHLYELRGADAHKPSSQIGDVIHSLEINDEMCMAEKGSQAILMAARSFSQILRLLQTEYHRMECVGKGEK